ncbi:hypothetical protein [Candidatus Phytoplasma solani]|uniref:hypothetical protein n=1 Tax=Candidatus Phytoplasma solani TaxID=69896 RepID=UPI00358E1AE9
MKNEKINHQIKLLQTAIKEIHKNDKTKILKMVDELKKEDFNLTTALKMLDIKRSTYYYWLKKKKIEIIKPHSSENDNNNPTLTNPTTPLKSQNNTLKTHFPIFQINYHNKQKDYIKELIGIKIKVDRLDTLKLHKLNSKKLDKYNNPPKTNYNWGLNTVYYREEDLKHIKSFLFKRKVGYWVKKPHPDYKKNLTKDKT